MSYLVTQMLLYLLGALLLGLLLGWLIWGRRSSNAAGMQIDVDRLSNENYSLRRDLAACSRARAVLEGPRADLPAARAKAAPEPRPAASPAVAKGASARKEPTSGHADVQTRQGASKKGNCQSASRPGAHTTWAESRRSCRREGNRRADKHQTSGNVDIQIRQGGAKEADNQRQARTGGCRSRRCQGSSRARK